MIRTSYGCYEGTSWDELCQRCFKIKYDAVGYQEMEASPGDFGIEGFTRSGLAFQCYCPDDEYSEKELYEKTRDKITKDLNKLKLYERQLFARLSGTILSQWHFVTPKTNRNDLLEHIAKKRVEVQGWNLPFLAPDFDIQIRDIDFLAKEIQQVLSIKGEKLTFGLDTVNGLELDWSQQGDFSRNINRKNTSRVGSATDQRLGKLNQLTFENLFRGDSTLKQILGSAPELYFRLAKLFNQYEFEVAERSITWVGTAEELIQLLRSDLDSLVQEEITALSVPDRRDLVNHMIARWIAICPLDFAEK